MPTTIVQATQVSLENYKNLRLEALQAEPQAFGTSYKDQKDASDDQWQEWLTNYKEEKHNWMVFASDGERLIGMVGAFQTDENIRENSAQIIAAYVTQLAQGKGVGELLLKHLINKFTKTNIKKLNLCVNVDQTAALNLYKKLGFQIVGKDTMTLGDGKMHDEYHMELIL